MLRRTDRCHGKVFGASSNDEQAIGRRIRSVQQILMCRWGITMSVMMISSLPCSPNARTLLCSWSAAPYPARERAWIRTVRNGRIIVAQSTPPAASHPHLVFREVCNDVPETSSCHCLDLKCLWSTFPAVCGMVFGGWDSDSRILAVIRDHLGDQARSSPSAWSAWS